MKTSKKHYKAIAMAAMAFLFLSSFGQVSMVYDLNTSTRGSYPCEFAVYHDSLFFQAIHEEYGSQLWVYDGITSPVLFSDPESDGFDFFPSQFIIFQDALYFSAKFSELFMYNGTGVPVSLDELYPEHPIRYPEMMKIFNGKLYFYARVNPENTNDETVGLFEYDGQTAPELIMNCGSWIYKMQDLQIFKDQLYFTVFEESENADQLYSYNQTDPPRAMADLYPGMSFRWPHNFTVFNDTLFFVTSDSAFAKSYWQYDGANAPVPDEDTLRRPLYYASGCVFEDKLYFSYNSELWVYDGLQPPFRLADLYPGLAVTYIGILHNFNNQLYFAAITENGSPGIWTFNGIDPPDTLFTNSCLCWDYSSRFPYCDGDFIFYNNNLYFRACGEGTGEELFVFDGVNPPELVADLNTRTNDSYPNNLFVFQDRLFFSSDMGPNCFWSYDGSGSPALVGDENLKLGGIAYFTVLKDTLYFCAFDDDEEGVWRYDGSTTPEMLTNLNADSNSIGMVGLTTFREKLYYWRLWIENPQYDPLLHTELCTYDGKNPPTILLEFAPDYSPRPDWEWSEFIEYQGKLFFSYVDSVNGAELWQLDGDNPPALVADINPGIGSSNPGNFGIYDNKLCFSADDGEHGPLLWVYDGVNPPSLTGEHGGYPQYLTEFKGKLYYSSLIGGYPYKLTVYDGHLAPYIFNFAGNACNPTDLMVFHNRLYFWADNGKTEYERGLWVYDGIDQARMIAKVPGSRYNPNALTPYKDILYFRGEDVFHGSELWKYNCIPTSATLEPLACNIYRSPSGYYSWTESGSYADTLTNCLGCDSLLTIDLEIFYGTVNTAVSLEGTTLTAEEEGAEYQWLDCDRAYAMLYSETEQSFTPDESGSYAVIVTDEEGCTDTSSCYMVEVPDELTDPLAGKLRIYPNPFNDQIIIEFSELPVGRTSIEILDITGKVMFTDNMECTEASHTVNLSAMEGGIYFVRISNEGFTVSKKVVKVD